MPRWSRLRGTAKNDAGRERPGGGFRHFTHQCFVLKADALPPAITLRQRGHEENHARSRRSFPRSPAASPWRWSSAGSRSASACPRSSATCSPASWSARTRRASSPTRDLAAQMAEIGVILLMFGVGMHFHPQELLRVWRIAVPGAIAQSAVATRRRLGVRARVRLEQRRGLRVRHGARGGEHRGADAHAGRPGPAGTRDGPRGRRLADRRGPVHRRRARRAAGARHRRRGRRAVRHAAR